MQGRIANASLSRPLARFFRCQDGFLSVVMAILLPAMIMVAGIAIDLSDLNAQRKAVQSQADLAALSGVRNLSTASTTRAAAARTLVQSEIYDIRPPARSPPP